MREKNNTVNHATEVTISFSLLAKKIVKEDVSTCIYNMSMLAWEKVLCCWKVMKKGVSMFRWLKSKEIVLWSHLGALKYALVWQFPYSMRVKVSSLSRLKRAGEWVHPLPSEFFSFFLLLQLEYRNCVWGKLCSKKWKTDLEQLFLIESCRW